MWKTVTKLICMLQGHKMGFYEHDFGEEADVGYGKRYKDVYHCTRCGLWDLRKEQEK